MKYILTSILVALALVGTAIAITSEAPEGFTCPPWEMPVQVLVDSGTDYIPAVTHEECQTVIDEDGYDEIIVDQEAWDEVVVDQEAWDELVIDQEAYYSCDYVGWGGDYKNSSCTQHGQWWQEVYKKVFHPEVSHIVHHDEVTHIEHHDAITHTVHHDEITHEECETIIDEPEVPGTDSVYEWQCIQDPDKPLQTPPSTSVSNDGNGMPMCILWGTCPCMGLQNRGEMKFLDNCNAYWAERPTPVENNCFGLFGMFRESCIRSHQ